MPKFNPDDPEEFYLESKEDLEDDNPIEEDLINETDGRVISKLIEDRDWPEDDFDDWDED